MFLALPFRDFFLGRGFSISPSCPHASLFSLASTLILGVFFNAEKFNIRLFKNKYK